MHLEESTKIESDTFKYEQFSKLSLEPSKFTLHCGIGRKCSFGIRFYRPDRSLVSIPIIAERGRPDLRATLLATWFSRPVASPWDCFTFLLYQRRDSNSRKQDPKSCAYSHVRHTGNCTSDGTRTRERQLLKLLCIPTSTTEAYKQQIPAFGEESIIIYGTYIIILFSRLKSKK